MVSVLVPLGLLVIVGVLIFLLLWQRQSAAAAQSAQWRNGYEAARKQANAAYVALERRSAAYETLIGDSRAGVGKCLADVREATEALRAGEPLAGGKGQPSPLHSMYFVDRFLARLLKAYAEDERDARDAQMRLALRRPHGVYAQIADQASALQPEAVVGVFFSVSMLAGRVCIRSTGKHDGSGRVLLARRDVARFFNDAVGQPRGWLADKNGGLVSRGCYRVDIKGDPRFGQMAMVAASPSSGELYLGRAEKENDQLIELRSLRKICERLLDEFSGQESLREISERARVLKRGAPANKIPAGGLCPNCDGDVTAVLSLGDAPANCPICSLAWSH